MKNKNFPENLLKHFVIRLFLIFAFTESGFAQSTYFPLAGDTWQRRTPEQAKINAGKLKEENW
jgi:hypothetical protein